MEITLATLIDLFLATKQTEGKTPKTLDWYRQKLEAFDQFLGGDTPLKEVTLLSIAARIVPPTVGLCVPPIAALMCTTRR